MAGGGILVQRNHVKSGQDDLPGGVYGLIWGARETRQRRLSGRWSVFPMRRKKHKQGVQERCKGNEERGSWTISR